MLDGFDVDAGHLAGFADMANELSNQAYSLSRHVSCEAAADTGYTGLMEAVKPYVNSYAQAASERFSNHVDRLIGVSNELTRAAWLYIGEDVEVSTTVNNLMVALTPQVLGEPNTLEEEFPDYISYSDGEELSLEVPPHDDPDIGALIDDVGGSIKAVDKPIAALTGWSPVSEIVEPMSGNWTELERAGKVLTQAGNGAETLASNLTSPLSKLDAHWEGGAASSFMEYAQRLATGIEQEGPLNRLVARVYHAVATEFENAAHFMVTTLKKAVDKIVEAAATSWVPGYGWKKIIDAVRAAINIIIEAQELVESLDRLVKSVKEVVEAARNPEDSIEGELKEKLAPVKEKIDESKAAFKIGKDIGDLASEPDAFDDTPQGADEDYSVGSNPWRPDE